METIINQLLKDYQEQYLLPGAKPNEIQKLIRSNGAYILIRINITYT